jgi:hypothetical protein
MRQFTRRDFLRTTAAGLLLPGCADSILTDPYAPLQNPTGAALLVQGRVHSGGRGLANVRVTDGLTVVATGTDGRYSLPTDTTREFVYITLPAGYDIPRNPTGTALFYQPIAAHGGVANANFELTPSGDDHQHAIIFLADIQTANTDDLRQFHAETVPDVIATARQLGVPATGIAVGDIMFNRLEFFPEYERAVQNIGIPFFQAIGNHDLNFTASADIASAATFTSYFGPRYYSFDRGDIHYVVLDDVHWLGYAIGDSGRLIDNNFIGYIDTDQLTWLSNDLAFIERGRTVIVTLHIPVLGSRHVRDGSTTPEPRASVANRDVLYRLLEPYRVHVVCGHTHECDHVLEQGVHEHVLGTVCGAWWSGPVCPDGAPNGYTVFDVKGEDVRWRYKATSLPLEHQMRLYAPDAAAPELIANIWDWDPEWRVVWFTDGEPRGELPRRAVGWDPLAVQLQIGTSKPVGRTWVEPNPNRHMFVAPAVPGVREYRVEASDRFGRTYTAAVLASP